MKIGSIPKSGDRLSIVKIANVKVCLTRGGRTIKSLGEIMKLNKLSYTVALIIGSNLSTQVLAESEANEHQLIVTANRIQQNINQLMANVEIITRDDIERIDPESINDLLISIAGLDIVTQGGGGQNSSVFARGANPDHTLILIDGVRVGSATDGKKALSAISVAHIERIEIVKGPRGSIWGSDAIGAVIQIFTRRYDNKETILSVKTGSNQFNAGSFSVGFGNDQLSHSFTLSSEASQGFDVLDTSNPTIPQSDTQPDDDGYRRISASLVGNYQLSDELALDWIVAANQGNAEFDNDWGADESDFKDHLYNIRYSYNHQQWQSTISYGSSRDWLLSYGNGVNFDNGDKIETRRDQLNASIGYRWENDIQLMAGFDGYRDNVSGSTDFDVTSRDTKGIFVYSSYSSDQWSIEGSLRYDDVERLDSDSSFTIATAYSFSDKLQLSASRGKGFKAPTFNDLYYPESSFFGGNPNLVSEVSYNNELTLNYRDDNYSISIARYQSDFENLINFESDPNFVLRPFNVDSAFVNGYEVVVNHRLENFHQKLSINYTNANEEKVDSVTNQTYKSKLTRRAEKSASYQLGYDFEHLTLFAEIIYKGERPDDDFNTWPATRVFLDSYTQLNLSAHYQVNDNFNLSLKLNDVTDEAPVHVLNYRTAGRQSYLSASYRF
jgi:vitamin B12 transporter